MGRVLRNFQGGGVERFSRGVEKFSGAINFRGGGAINFRGEVENFLKGVWNYLELLLLRGIEKFQGG